jgi:Short C-terminal domain
MIGRRAVVRRRPLLRAAAVGGTFAAGRAMGRRSEQQSSAEYAQDERISAVENNQAQGAPPAQAAGNQGAAQAGPSVADQLNQLAAMHQQGALSDDEFAAAKAQVLGG